MIRFRNKEDERRYTILRTEIFARLAEAGVPSETLAMAMRNLGKVEMMIYLDALRQGLAMGAIAASADEKGALSEPRALKAWQLHAAIYGSSDSPLRETELEWLRRMEIGETWLATSWLDDKPLRFAPMTLTEWLGEQAPVAPVYKIDAPYAPVPVTRRTETPETLPAPKSEPDDTSDSEAMRELDAALEELVNSDEDPAEIMRRHRLVEDKPAGPEEPIGGPESPEFCDRVRDAIQTLQKGGWKPGGWVELIRGLHLHMHVDAAYLDLQLSTHVGRTVLDQCGLFGIAPGTSVILQDLLEGGEVPLSDVLPSPPEEPEPHGRV